VSLLYLLISKFVISKISRIGAFVSAVGESGDCPGAGDQWPRRIGPNSGISQQNGRPFIYLTVNNEKKQMEAIKANNELIAMVKKLEYKNR